MNFGIIGIELCSTKIVVSYLNQNSINIVQSQTAAREIPSYITFCQRQRLFSEQALTRIQTNFKNTIRYPIRYLGKKTLIDSRQILGEYSVSPESEEYKFTVEFQQQKHQLYAFQITAGLLSYLQQIIKQKTQDLGLVVIAVPSYFSQTEVINLQKAIQISSFPVAKIIYAHEALLMNYVYQFKNELIQKKSLQFPSSNICIIDIGYSSTTISIASLDGITAQILAVRCEKELGIRQIDYQVYEFLLNIFINRQPTTDFQFPFENQKLELRLLTEIQSRMRKILSANPSTQILIQDFYNGLDLRFQMTRDILEKEGAINFQQNFQVLLEETAFLIQQNKINIDAFEICGGGSRIPFIQNMIKNIFQIDKFGTVIGEEFISKGTTVEAALVAKEVYQSIQIQDFSVQSCLMKSLQITFRFVDAQEQLFISGKNPTSKITPDYHPDLIIKQIYSPEFTNLPAEFDLSTILDQQKVEAIGQLLSTQTDQFKKSHRHLDIFVIEIAEDNSKIPFYSQYITLPIGTNLTFLLEDFQYKIQLNISIPNNFTVSFENAQFFIIDKMNKNYQINILNNGYYFDTVSEEEIKFLTQKENQFQTIDDQMNYLKEKMNQYETLVLNVSQIYHQKYRTSNTINPNDLLPLQAALENGEQIREKLSSSEFGEVPINILIDSEKQITHHRNKIESIINSVQKIEININRMDDITPLYSQKYITEKKQISGINFRLRGHNIGDGTGSLGLYKSGASQIFQLLIDLAIKDSINFDLGNCSLTDTGMESIFKGLQMKIIITSFVIDIHTTLSQPYGNQLTLYSITKLLSTISNYRQLKNLEIYIDFIDANNMQNLQNILQTKFPKLSSVNLHIHKGKIENYQIERYIDYLISTDTILQADFKYYDENGMLKNEFYK